MLALNKTIQRLAEQLRGFSATAKMLIAALLVILVMGLILVAGYAGRPDLVPLGLRGNLSAETRARAINYLDGRGVRWAEGDGDLLVPQQKYAVLAQLTERQLITADQIDFNSILKEDSPFTDQRTKSKRFLVAKMNVVARMISEMSAFERASVVIDQPQRSGIGVRHVEPTAFVTVQTVAGPLTQEQADAIAGVVAGSHAALRVDRVTIVDARTSRALKARSDDQLSSGEYYDRKVAAERHAKRTIEEALSVMIPGVVVAVNATMDVTEVVRRTTGYEDPKQGVMEESVSERTSTSRTGGGEPGVLPNTAADLAAAGGGGESTSDTESAVSMLPVFPTEEAQIRDPKGYAMQINASVLVPKSYFINLYRDDQDDEEAQPDASTLAALVQTGTEEIKQLVVPLIDPGPVAGAVVGTVVVSMFHDYNAAGLGTLGGPGGGGLAGSSGGIGGGLVSDRIITSVGLGALALLSLLLMFMMVRKAAGREEEMPTAEELVGIPPALAQTDSDVVGEASESIAAMEGVEIGEDDLRRQQMLKQINEMAVGTPAEAANLLRKWIRHHE